MYTHPSQHRNIQPQSITPPSLNSRPHHYTRQEDIPGLSEHLSKRQGGGQEEENSSEAGMSELSSIPPETDERANSTIDSEASSLHHATRYASASEQRVVSTTSQGERAGSDRGVEVDGRERQTKARTMKTQHPLHVVHRMAPGRRSGEHGEAGEDVGHQDKVHGQLRSLEQVCYSVRTVNFSTFAKEGSTM